MGSISSRLSYLRGVISNVVSSQNSRVSYITESDPWAIQEIGNNLNEHFTSRDFRITTSAQFCKSEIIHFGSAPTLTKSFKRSPHTKVCIATWFHIANLDQAKAKITRTQHLVDIWHTSCAATASALHDLGIPENKIAVIPLGVDLRNFRRASEEEKSAARYALTIPDDAFVVSSFVKDGNGWKEGLTPKLIKGPDILVSAVKFAHEQNKKICVLLSGPSRGYVMQSLTSAGVPFIHRFVERATSMRDLYWASDCIVISSRAEGGPLCLLEGMACEVPIISTPVGMVADILEHGTTGLLASVDNAPLLGQHIIDLANRPQLGELLSSNASQIVHKFAWSSIANRYAQELYRIP